MPRMGITPGNIKMATPEYKDYSLSVALRTILSDPVFRNPACRTLSG
jgi:hypothetical protein